MKKALLPLLLLAALPLAAQTPPPTSSIPCGADFTGAKLEPVPEISSEDTGVLRGTLYTVSEQVKMSAVRPGSDPTCYPQWVRAYRRSGHVFVPLRRGPDRAGAILAVGDDAQDALARARRAAASVRFEVDAHPS